MVLPSGKTRTVINVSTHLNEKKTMKNKIIILDFRIGRNLL